MSRVRIRVPTAALFAAVLGAAFAGVGEARADERRALPRYDPFERPSFEPPSGPGQADPGAGWTPWLRATLMAGERSMANLGGVLLALGEETHGYRLVEVREWQAVFVKDGERVVLDVDPTAGQEPARRPERQQ